MTNKQPYMPDINITDYITVDPETLGGKPVFKGTRVPIESLFDHLEAGYTIDVFHNDFQSVSYDQAKAVLGMAYTALLLRLNK